MALQEEVAQRKPAKNQKTKKVSILAKKIMKQCVKPLQKIMQVGNRTYNTKKQKSKHTDKQIIVYNTYQNTVQIAKTKQAKKMCH